MADTVPDGNDCLHADFREPRRFAVLRLTSPSFNVLNADSTKLLYAYDGHDHSGRRSVAAFHPQASGLADILFDRWRKTKKNAGDGTVTFTGGGNGSGKRVHAVLQAGFMLSSLASWLRGHAPLVCVFSCACRLQADGHDANVFFAGFKG